MKNVMLILAGVVIGVVVLGVAGLAYAQVQGPSGGYFGPGMMGGYGRGMMGGYRQGMMGGSGYGPMHTYMVEAFAEGLGLTAEELQEKIEAGSSMWEIAAAEGLSEDEISALMLSARSTALEEAVAAGALTQEQADWMNQHMAQMLAAGMKPGACHGAGGGRWNQPADE